MNPEERKNKIFISSVIEFLSADIHSSLMSEERKESIEVAIQCLETAYQVPFADREKLPKVDLFCHIPDPIEGVSEESVKIAEEHKTAGNTAMKEGRYDEAILEYTQAIKANNTNAVYFCNRAAAYSRLDNNQGAIEDCKQALILDPTYGKAYGRLGIAYSNLNKWPEAIKAYQDSLKFDPENESYKTNLALARDHLMESMESAAPPQHRPIDISQFINNESFVTMAREMMANPDFQSIMSNIMAMGQSGDTNFEALFQAGQNLASQMQFQDPNFVQNLRRQFDQASSGSNDSAGSDTSNRDQPPEEPPKDPQ